MLDFNQTSTIAVTIAGGGLPNPRTLTVAGTLPDGTAVASGSLTADPTHVTRAASAATQLRVDQQERTFWGRVFPGVLLLAALLTLFTAVRAQRRLTSVAEPAATPVPATRRNLNV